ncbi:AAA family ATPase [Streptomyces macrosporus]|uniref:AAA family ATPase n=1 Tax=Streptomyces macrosporus TaxID=44032 RepID=A0ABN3K492_9ACTN
MSTIPPSGQPSDSDLAALAEAGREEDNDQAADLCPDHHQRHPCLHRAHAVNGAAAPIPQVSGSADLVFRPLSEYAAEVDASGPPRWLFRDALVDGDYGMLSAEDKAGKTWALLDAAVSCAAGLPWLGRFGCEKPGPVIVFFGEGSKRKAVRRIRAIAVSKGLTREQADALEIIPVFRSPQLKSAQHQELIRQAIAQYRPSLVIVDPLYLAASGAKSSDLISMGELLGSIQHIVQDGGASLIISHHWNKTGSGSGHDRSSGVGPGAWGRFLISMGVKNRSTDPVTGESTVTLSWALRGDEIPDRKLVFIRKVGEEVPGDLTSAMRYAVLCSEVPEDDEEDGVRLTPAERKVLEALGDRPSTIPAITDRIASRYGHGLKRNTVSAALNKLKDLGLTTNDNPLPGHEKTWERVA